MRSRSRASGGRRLLPDVPTARKPAIAELDGDGWIGVLVPAGSPREIVDLLNRDNPKDRQPAGSEAADGAVRLRFVGTTPEEFSAQLKIEMEKWGKVIRAANIKAK